MIVVSDMSDKDFLPMPEDMVVNLHDSYEIVSNLLDNLPYYFMDNPNPAVETSMLHALNSCFNISQKPIGGRIILFQASQCVTRLPELTLKPDSNKDAHAKFSSSTNFF